MKRHRWLFGFVTMLLVIAVVYWWFNGYGRPYSAAAPIRQDSTSLKQTVFVPTLDTPLTQGKSSVWCAAFELAWKRAENDLIKNALRTQNSPEISARLNSSLTSENDVAPESLTIQSPDIQPNGIGASAKIKLDIPFKIPFFENDVPFEFKDSKGTTTKVASFGIRPKDEYAYYQLRSQVAVLGTVHDNSNYNLTEFAVDLDRNSNPYQIVLAVISPKSTLEEDVEYVKNMKPEWKRGIGPNDRLLVPNQNWEFHHQFKELLGPITNPGFADKPLVEASETVRFKLDRSGAELSSEAKVYYLPIPNLYYFNRPFLVYIQKRGAAQPMFAAWVENAELLQKY
jgi:hypothetical protein